MPPYGQRDSRDRTPEFNALVERLQREQGGTSASVVEDITPAYPPRTNGHAAKGQQSEFARRAARIGLGIHSTSQKLAKLAQLAKRTSMFDDPAAEINDLTGVIKQDIQAMNAAIVELQAVSSSDHDRNRQSQDHSVVVVDSLRTQLKDATKSFKDVLTLRTDNLKGNEDRRRMFSASPTTQPQRPQQNGQQGGALVAQRPSPFPSRPGFGDSSSITQRAANGPRSAQDLFGGSGSRGGTAGAGSSGEGVPLLQQQQQQQVVLQDTYYESRSEALQNVESTIVELGGIFQQLAHMVQEQGEMAVRIDENLDDTVANVESAQTQLLKYLNTISSNRWLVIKIMAVLMFFSMVFLFIT
eukprot:CAMPEP_0206144480 /NCGR_PEP_ID=MMETSP1473-20131121/24218_1 /ASSEMBLY_ACC=CAM_ASM_001109 /TAXON_ID=1461547 /ORGANISM="Stichococcus sp, Strain RCC1054" /LENGTH=355 /DNA_ID=CAMNT_0053540305 /DNA_START=151 /DNA_END=1218 /DNA_ORIENTATION=-